MYTTSSLAALAIILAPSMVAAAPVTPEARSDDCTKNSMAVTQWAVTNFDYHADYIFSTPAHQNSWGYVNFNVTNPAIDYVVSCSAASNQLSTFFYGNMIYTCKGPDGTPSPATTTFTFNQPTGEVTLSQTWTCDDDTTQ
jgi:hypothetical protein